MFKKDKNLAGLETVISLVTKELEKATPGTPEFDKLAEQLDRLNKIAASRKSEPWNKNGFVAAVTNLTGIVLILNHERLHVVTSKAVGFIGKLK
jgi:hypothetical protein